MTISERPGKHVGQGSSGIFFCIKESPKNTAIFDLALSSSNVAYHWAQIKVRTVYLNTTEMYRPLFIRP